MDFLGWVKLYPIQTKNLVYFWVQMSAHCKGVSTLQAIFSELSLKDRVRHQKLGIMRFKNKKGFFSKKKQEILCPCV
jgi:hypothetical protein